MREADFLRQVRDLARILGWKVYHHPYSLGADPGFPDLVLVRDRVVFMELKGPKGKLSDQQREWLESLQAAGAEAYVFWPDDLEKIQEILQKRKGAPD